MKLRYFTMAAAAATMLFSCAKEKNGGGGEFEGEITKATVTITIGDAESRAVTFPSSDATSAEKTIYNAIAVAFDNRGLLEAVSEPFDRFKEGGSDASALTLNFSEITTGLHTFYVVANAPTTILARIDELTSKGMTVADFIKEMAQIGHVEDVIREKTGAGSNDLGSITRGFFMTSETSVTVTLTVDGPNNVPVRLVRTVAKVSVAYDPDTATPYGEVSGLKYKVVNNPAKFYIFRNESGGILYTPFFSDAYNSANYIGAAHDYQDVITDLNGASNYTYCIENSNMTALQGNSTMVYIKGVFTPDTYVDANGSPMQYSGDGTFWKVRDRDTGAWDNTVFYGEQPANLTSDQEAVKYDKGVCYYHTWLQKKYSKQYMVDRNSYVKLTITAINGVGEPDENEGIDPPSLIDETTDAVVKVEVVDWDDEDQSTTV